MEIIIDGTIFQYFQPVHKGVGTIICVCTLVFARMIQDPVTGKPHGFGFCYRETLRLWFLRV